MESASVIISGASHPSLILNRVCREAIVNITEDWDQTEEQAWCITAFTAVSHCATVLAARLTEIECCSDTLTPDAFNNSGMISVFRFLDSYRLHCMISAFLKKIITHPSAFIIGVITEQLECWECRRHWEDRNTGISGALGAMLELLGIFVSEECWNCMRQCDSRNAVTTEHSCATSNFGIEEYINPMLRKVYFEPCH